MSELNPYEKFLDGRALDTILAATPGEIGRLILAIGVEKENTAPASGKWSAGRLLRTWQMRAGVRVSAAADAGGEWANDSALRSGQVAATYMEVQAKQALEVFTALRGWNLRLIGLSLPEAGDRPVKHPERGSMTFLTIVETMAGHDLNHLGQLKKLAA